MKKQFMMVMMLLFSYHAASPKQNFGPRLTAMGMNSAAVIDEWSITGNPAGIALIQSSTIALNYVKYLSGTDISKQGILFIFPFEKNVIGFDFYSYGISQFNEITAAGVMARQFGNQISFALKINYHQIKISGYGTTSGFSVDVGVIYTLNQQLKVGLYINNPTLQEYSNKLINIVIPSAIYTGLSYEISNKILLATTISKHIGFALDVGLGIEYKLIDALSIRTGITIKPFKKYAGIGLAYKKFSFSTTIEDDPFISYKPQLGISYAF
jgi:opacity protein-like surface antigen